MSVKRTASVYSTGIQQSIAANHTFDGTLPTGDTTDANTGNNNLYKYAKQNAGGLFVWDMSEPIIVTQVHVDVSVDAPGGTADISLYIVNLDDRGSPIAEEGLLIHQVTAARYLSLTEATFRETLLINQALKLVTTSSTKVQVAHVYACLERMFMR